MSPSITTSDTILSALERSLASGTRWWASWATGRRRLYGWQETSSTFYSLSVYLAITADKYGDSDSTSYSRCLSVTKTWANTHTTRSIHTARSRPWWLHPLTPAVMPSVLSSTTSLLSYRRLVTLTNVLCKRRSGTPPGTCCTRTTPAGSHHSCWP